MNFTKKKVKNLVTTFAKSIFAFQRTQFLLLISYITNNLNIFKVFFCNILQTFKNSSLKILSIIKQNVVLILKYIYIIAVILIICLYFFFIVLAVYAMLFIGISISFFLCIILCIICTVYIKYYILYTWRNLKISIKSFFFFFINIIILLLFNISLYYIYFVPKIATILWKDIDQIYMFSYLLYITPICFLFIILCGFIEQPILKHNLLCICLYNEIYSIFKTWNTAIFDRLTYKFFSILLTSNKCLYFWIALHMFFILILPILNICVISNFIFFAGDLYYMKIFILFSFLGWIYRHIYFYIMQTRDDTLRYIRQIVWIESSSQHNDKLIPKHIYLTITTEGLKKNITPKDLPKIKSIYILYRKSILLENAYSHAEIFKPITILIWIFRIIFLLLIIYFYIFVKKGFMSTFVLLLQTFPSGSSVFVFVFVMFLTFLFIYNILYSWRHVDKTIASFFIFSINLILLLIFLAYCYVIIYVGLPEKLFWNDVGTLFMVRSFYITIIIFGLSFILGFILGICWLFNITDTYKNYLLFPYLYVESYRILKTWERGFLPKISDLFLTKIYKSQILKYFWLSLHLSFLFIIPSIQLFFVGQFFFFEGTFKNCLNVIPFIFLGWVYRHLYFYVMQNIEVYLSYINNIVTITYHDHEHTPIYSNKKTLTYINLEITSYGISEGVSNETLILIEKTWRIYMNFCSIIAIMNKLKYVTIVLVIIRLFFWFYAAYLYLFLL